MLSMVKFQASWVRIAEDCGRLFCEFWATKLILSGFGRHIFKRHHFRAAWPSPLQIELDELIQGPIFIEQMIAFKNFTRTTFNLVLFLFSHWVTDRLRFLGSSFSTLNTPYYCGQNKESNKKAPYNFGVLLRKTFLFTIQKAVKQSLINWCLSPLQASLTHECVINRFLSTETVHQLRWSVHEMAHWCV